MKVLGIDPATRTGYCFTGNKEMRGAKVGSFKLPAGNNPALKSSFMAEAMVRLIQENGKPDFAMVEEPLYQGPNQFAIVQLSQMFAAAKAVLIGYGVATTWAPANSWRKKMYGQARIKGYNPKMWKDRAKTECERMGVAVQNIDEAEAVIIAQYAFFTQEFRAKTGATDGPNDEAAIPRSGASSSRRGIGKQRNLFANS